MRLVEQLRKVELPNELGLLRFAGAFRHTGMMSEKEAERCEGGEEQPEVLDPNDSNLLRDQIKGQTTEHATPPRLEDEGQSGG